MGEAQTPHFYDFQTFEPVTRPQNQVFLSLETPGSLKRITKSPWNISKNIICINVKVLETRNVDIVRKDGHRKMVKIRLIQSQKSWICISYLSKNMKWKFANM